MVKPIDAGMTEPIHQELQNNDAGFDGSGFNVDLELLQIGGASWLPGFDYTAGMLTRPVPPAPGTIGGSPPAVTGRVYLCILSGTSDVSNEPVWLTAHGDVVLDGTVEWLDITPTVDWVVAEVGSVAVTNYHHLPGDTAYRVRYRVTDGNGATGAVPNGGRYDVWEVRAVMAG